MGKPKGAVRTFSLEFKRKVVERIAGGETIAALSAELGIRRQVIYRWRDALRDGGTPRPRGRPSKAAILARGLAAEEQSELAAARRRVAELERKVGQQALELDFFQQALRRIEASRPSSNGPGATTSSPRSRR
jgi:transposase-like protein